ncbi:hypothetical protein Abr02nite_18230 [Paractinoplanes brasiliensis]|nr:hypothetical protein Abr02nite_18230 [Actinoplanes brasiliensis]
MMRSGLFDRFDVRPLFLDHLRSMRRVQLDVDEERLPPDLASRLVLYGIPAAVGVVAVWQQWRLTDPGAIGAGCALMAGILFTAFTQLASLRDRLEDRHESIGESSRRLFRETAAHLLVGALASATESIVLIVASGVRAHPDDKMNVASTAIVLPIAVYVFLLFIMAIRKMYAAYLRVFEGGRYLRATRKTGR